MEGQLAYQLGDQTVNQLDCQLLVMSGRTVAREAIMQTKIEQTPEGEPIDVFKRDVRAGNGELLQCIPKEMHSNLGIGEDTTLKIAWYHNGFFVTAVGDNGSE